MIGKKVINQEPVPLAEVKELIAKKKKAGELSYEQNLTLEYCKKFSKLSIKDGATLIEELVQLDKLSKENAIELADLLPKTSDEVKLVFAKEHFVLSDEDVTSILDILSKYRK
jgi:DNA-directed RNA polymerase subunit F